ncbi:MMPL family transporter [Halapricum sp. CBA1109]|uniref:efflux RND transporter permease subunit n=1 Tax=Halapricum sp. CBA1109 TaxID=2668068 RepID=UPI0012FA0211|nr:MMPL family transporter [Halapricum sp. CBA1109]MUV90581.1 MMPL family transporter [Halapricum sp. CBA1109]
MLRDALRRTIGFVTDHNVLTLVVMLVLTGVVAGGGIPQVDQASQAGADADAFDNERIQKAEYVQNNYGDRDDGPNRTLRQVYVRNESGDVLTRDSLIAGLAYQQSLLDNKSVRASLHDPGITGLSNLVATRVAGDPNATVDEQVAALDNASDAEVDRAIAETVQQDPRAQRFLPTDHDHNATTSTDRRMLVPIAFDADSDDRNRTEAALYEVAQDAGGANVFTLTGPAADEYRSHFFTQMVQLVVPVALALILFVLAFSYRDLVDIVVGMTGVVLSVLWMFGLLGWFGVGAGVITIIPVVLVTGLSIDFGFHVFNRYREERGAEEDIREPMGRGVRLVATALILVTVTAAIGFLSNLANPLPVIQDLGITITLGVVSALVLFVTVVPALKISIDGLLERVGLDRRKQALGRGRFLEPVLESSVTLARRAAPVVVVLALLVGLAGGAAWTGLEQESFQGGDQEIAEWKQELPGPLGWETNPYAEQSSHVDETYQPASTDDARQTRILIENDVTADDTLEDIRAGVDQTDEEGLLLDRSSGQVVQSPTTVMQRTAARNETFAAVLAAEDTDDNGVPDRNLDRVYDAFYAADAENASTVIERTDGEYRSVLVTMSLTADWAETDSTVATLEDTSSTMAGDGRSATVVGSLAVNASVLDELTDSILLTMLVALVAIVLTLSAVFRLMHGSATLGAVVAVPIGIVVGLVIAGMYLLDIPLTLLTALLMSLVIGLGVDYNIHVGDRFADELHAGKDTYAALSAAVTGTGGALLGSTLTSAGAFLTIALVPSTQLQSFAALVVIALLASFAVSVLVLPSGLVLWKRFSPADLATPTPGEDALPQD